MKIKECKRCGYCCTLYNFTLDPRDPLYIRAKDVISDKGVLPFKTISRVEMRVYGECEYIRNGNECSVHGTDKQPQMCKDWFCEVVK